MKPEAYIEEYRDFVSGFKSHPISGSEIGEVIVRMAAYYGTYNLNMIEALHNFNQVASGFEKQTDDNGKPLSSTKAQVLAEATNEYKAYQTAKAHVLNLEQFINALKSLQKGVIVEFNNSSLS